MKAFLALAALLALLALPSATFATNVNFQVIAATGDQTGVRDTANIQAACNAGKTANLNSDSIYYVKSVTCARIAFMGVNNRPYFQGQNGAQTPNQAIYGVAASQNAIVCPSPGPCAYREFDIFPAPGAAGIAINGTVRVVILNDMSIIDQNAESTACIDMTAAPNNQELQVENSTFVHCGGYCIDAGVTSDSYISNAIIANCSNGGVHVAYGYGWTLTPSKVEGMFTGDGAGIRFDTGGTTVMGNTVFDQNLRDVMTGSGSGSTGWYGNVSNIIDARLGFACGDGLSVFDIEGQTALDASNIFEPGAGCGATYYLNPNPNGPFFGNIEADIAPTYFDANTQAVVSPFVDTNQ